MAASAETALRNVGNAAMIEVTAKVVRGPVYLAGETVECYITFSNTLAPVHRRSQSNR
jgi:hypothetical protein